VADYTDILYEVEPPIAYITLNRPEKMNALSNLLRGELVHALKESELNDDVAVVVVRGAGRAFSAGYDIGGGMNVQGEAPPYVHPKTKRPDVGSTRSAWANHVNDTNWTIWNLYKPVIAQVHGYCLAGGTELASVCDFRIVAEDAKIGYPPVRAMTTPDMMWMPWLLPMSKAREFAYLGDSMSGAEAAQWGWATRAVPQEDLAATVEWYGKRLALIDRDMLFYSKRAVNRAYEVMGIRTAIEVGADIQALSAVRPTGGMFGKISRNYGLKEALDWRDGPFGDGRLRGEIRPRKQYPELEK
jgi:enoyl-CoA hydratase